MCTVTYIPVQDTFFITSNRDEKNVRKAALPPSVYKAGKQKLIYPKDGDAGGSWIALHENGNAAVLLNGAFQKHVPSPPYRISRGKVFLEIIAGTKPCLLFQRANLHNIEPFTLLLFEQGNVYDCRWDGYKKQVHSPDRKLPAIWSSVTLYEADQIQKREWWFARFLRDQPHPTQKDILAFHQFTGDGDETNDLVMKRENLYATVSITSMFVTADRGSMRYIDLKTKQATERKIEFQPSCELI